MILSPIISYGQGGGPSSGDAGTITTGHFYYWPQIKNLIGGVSTTDLDAQRIDLLPVDSVVEVIIPDRGASQWLRVQNNSFGIPPTNAVSPDSDPDGGTIVPINYNPVSNPWILLRQLGF